MHPSLINTLIAVVFLCKVPEGDAAAELVFRTLLLLLLSLLSSSFLAERLGEEDLIVLHGGNHSRCPAGSCGYQRSEAED